MDSKEYFQELRKMLENAYSIATEARKKGLDPVTEVEIKITTDVAARVEGIVGPEGISKIIRELESGGMQRETIAFEIAKKIVRGETSKKGTTEELIEQAVRTGVGILTEGVLVAPTEGISKVKINENPDGSNYVAVYFSGPIRSAGGTAAALSVVLADVARREAKVGDYRTTDTQIERYVEEVNTYEARCVHLQYKPSDADVRHVVMNCPVCINGEPTEEVEVSAYRDVPGVETNRVRGGVPLVLCEGIAQKAAKVLKYTKKLELDWDWLEKIIKIKKKEDKIEIKPDDSYLEGLVAGRPVFSYPSRKGGFRLRYGKSRTNGIMAKNIHPATMILTDEFLAYGTHMKIERPGKGCVVSGNENLEPPMVKLKKGDVIKVHTIEQAEEIKNKIESILFLGDMLVTYGDFLKSNHPLVPSAWCYEWFAQLAEKKGAIVEENMKAKEAFEVCRKYELPLHPSFTYNWNEITIEELKSIRELFFEAEKEEENGRISRVKVKNSKEKEILEKLLVEHKVEDGKVVINGEDGFALLATLNVLDKKEITYVGDILEILHELAGVVIKPKMPTYIGARMGRPEKAKERKMDGSPNVLYPTGSQNRSITKIYKTLKSRGIESTINLELGRFRCSNCKAISFQKKCEKCGGLANIEKMCIVCKKPVNSDIHCDKKTSTFDKRPIKIVEIIDSIKKDLQINVDELKGVKGLSNPNRVPERLEKGFIRAKNEVYIFRDGTCRFDATDIPLTHFFPDEIGLSVSKARELGYDKDYLSKPLTDGSQLVPLKHQDIVLANSGAEYFIRVARFIDEMLVDLYKIRPYYKVSEKKDLIGHLCIGLSPHTSAGVICRIIGITKANVGYGHPYFHTAKRRNCFYPNTRIEITNASKPAPEGSAATFEMIFEDLETIVEKLIKGNTKKVKRLDDATIKVEMDEELYVTSLDPKTFKIIQRKIKCFIKTKAPEYWVRIKTEHGKEMVVTPDHNVLCIKNKKLKAIEAQHVKEGMFVPVEKSSGSKALPSTINEEKIIKIEKVNEDKPAYCLDIETETDELIEKNVLLDNGIFCIRCDGDEDCVMLLMDGLINFSKEFLTDRIGGTMDTPLVLTPAIDPKEVDDEAHSIEFVDRYPLELYEASEKITPPGKIKIKTVKDVLGEEEQYGNFPLTVLGGYLDKGPTKTRYVTLGSIPEKIEAEFRLHELINAVDLKNTAERLILSHFIPDLYGNLRSYSRQTFRCVSCNTIYRRVPLAGKCIKCGGNLLLTINKGGIQKYLEISKNMAVKYDLPLYLKQRLDLVEKEIKSIFEDDKIKQMGLADFM
ncbi:MAG TPA: DNA polymerase II large subunit [Candidatus Bilamarchaeaceae archaeon]|nr:DNA polymerase II large subunit [Candidatus Bilamarchaeaceae archaeon]